MTEKLKEFKKKLAKKGGFTLVELIVVIAILGILAAVAVPTYTGYISEARKAGDLQLLSSVATAVTAVKAGDGETVTTIQVAKSSGAITSTPALSSTQEAEVFDLIGFDDAEALKDAFKGEWTTATMSGGEWTLN